MPPSLCFLTITEALSKDWHLTVVDGEYKKFYYLVAHTCHIDKQRILNYFCDG
jgi:hypothetical protein